MHADVSGYPTLGFPIVAFPTTVHNIKESILALLATDCHISGSSLKLCCISEHLLKNYDEVYSSGSQKLVNKQMIDR